jgi:undecaprenyl-diphosphatase
MGTLLAVFAVLWRDIWDILRKIIQPLTLFLIIATIPAVIVALTLGDVIENAFESGKFLGVCFLITTALLVFAEYTSKHKELKKAENMRWFDALFIGLLQAIAIAPGISRSGATISGALFRRLDRDFAARFSFLLSIPAILGALVLHTKDLVTGGVEESVSISTPAIIAGTACAAIVGFFSVKLMLKIIKERSLYGFAIYTAVLGILILIDQFGTHFVF